MILSLTQSHEFVFLKVDDVIELKWLYNSRGYVGCCIHLLCAFMVSLVHLYRRICTKKSTNTIYIENIVCCQQCLCSFYIVIWALLFSFEFSWIGFLVFDQAHDMIFKHLKIQRTYLFYRNECKKIYKLKLISFEVMASTRMTHAQWTQTTKCVYGIYDA